MCQLLTPGSPKLRDPHTATVCGGGGRLFLGAQTAPQTALTMLYHTARLDHSLGHTPAVCVGGACSQVPGPLFCPGSGMLNSHAHSMPANGEMNGGHSSQTMVSGSHCTPPPPYHADPSLVRCVG